MVLGQIASHKICENKNFVAILEPKPLNFGHTLIFPRKETDFIFDLENKELSDMILFSKKIAKAIRRAIVCKKIALVVYGLKTRHAHIHLVPVYGKAKELDLDNKPRRQKLGKNIRQMQHAAKQIKKFL